MPSCERGNLEHELKRDLALLSDAVEKPTDQAQGSYAATLVCSKNSSGARTYLVFDAERHPSQGPCRQRAFHLCTAE